MKRILYLSYFFEPDLSAGSFRNTSLVKELSSQVKDQAIIDVVTTMPNRYQSFSREAKVFEAEDNLRISRIKVPLNKKGFLGQIFCFASYYFQVLRFSKKNKYDLVFASSSKFFTSYLGYYIAKRQKAKLYLDIRDIFIDTINDVIDNKIIKFFLLPILILLEKRVFSKATHINLISPGFKSYFDNYKLPNYSFFTNGIDSEFLNVDLQPPPNGMPIVITYAGNLGEGQGLHKIIPFAAKILGNNYYFNVIGDGGAKKQLLDLIKSENLTNVSVFPPVSRSELIEVYSSSHYLFIHLNDYKAFEKVLPSKVFELGALQRPIIAGVGGYAKEFIRENIKDAIVIPPADPYAFCEELKKNVFQLPNRPEFKALFNRSDINRKMAKSVKQYI